MARINLLPWREERRAELQKEFLTLLGAVVIFAFALVFLVDRSVNGAIEAQQTRNQYIEKHIKELDEQVKEIRSLEKKKRELLDRMKVIQELQGNRPIIVRVFDEMVRTVPDGMYYVTLSMANKRIALTGTAESNNRISSLMRNLDSSEWFAGPNLKTVKANPAFGDQASDFSLTFNVSTPADKKGDE